MSDERATYWRTRAERFESQLAEARAEIEAWKLASGLEDSSGDPDGVTPAIAEAYWGEVEKEATEHKLRLENTRMSLRTLMCVWEPGQGPDVPRTEIHADLKYLRDTGNVRPKQA